MNGDLWDPCRSCSLEPRRGLKDKSLPAHITACPWSALTGKPAERRHCHCCLPLCRVMHTQATNTHTHHTLRRNHVNSQLSGHTLQLQILFVVYSSKYMLCLEDIVHIPKVYSLRVLMQLPKYQLCLRCFLSPVNAAEFFFSSYECDICFFYL